MIKILETLLRALAGAPYRIFADAARSNPTVAIEELRNKVCSLVEQARTIKASADAEHRPMSSEESAQFSAILDAVDSTKAEIAQSERLLALETEIQSPSARRTQPDGERPAAAAAPTPQGAPSHGRPLVTGGLPSGTTQGAWGFRSLGEFAIIVKAAVRGHIDPRLAANAAPSTWGSEGVGEDGGFAVPPDMRTEILSKVMGEESLLQYTDQQISTSNQLTVPKDETTAWQTSGGVQAYWENEGAQLRASKIELQTSTIRLNKLTSLIPVTSELLEDASALASYLRRKAPEKMTFKINDALLNGSGSGQPQGMFSAGAKVAVAKETGQTNLTVNFANITNMWARMYAPCRRRAVWLVNQDIEPQLIALAFPNLGAGTVVPAYLPPGGLSSSPYGMLMGRPVIPTEACQQLGYEGDIALVDFSQYLSVTKAGGVRSDVSIHLWFDYDMTAFRFIMRLGGACWWTSAIKRAHGTNTLSCVVTLADRHA